MSDSGETQTVGTLWVGPAQADWRAFAVARAVLRVRMRHPALRHVPGARRVTAWAFDVTIGSRDMAILPADSEDGGDA